MSTALHRAALLAAMLSGPMLLALSPAPTAAQGVELTVGDVGLGIGPVPRIDGLRVNFRDDYRLERVRGINATIWAPHEDIQGDVTGLALGLPLTGARNLTGIGLAAGIAVHGDFRGVAVAPIGMGTGGDMEGVMVSGIGAGAGNNARGILVGGIGVGAGNRITGVAVGGIGVGAGNSATGVLVGGVGAGVGNSMSGIAVGGLGVGVGNRITGIALAGLGIGAGGHLHGLSVAGLGIGAPRITGLAAALGVGGQDVHGLVLAPAYFRLEEHGLLRGVSVSAYNDIRGEQRGLTIGIINIAHELHGLQIGLLNIARNKDTLPVMPLFNYHP